MSSPETEPGDKPEAISPDAAAVIARARRSFAFSIGLLVIGFLVVALALVYRSSKGNENPGVEYAAGVLVIPGGSTVISAVPTDGLIAVTYDLNGKTHLRLINGTTGAIVRDIDFVTE